VDWIQMAPDRDKWRALMKTVMNIRVPWDATNFLTSWMTVKFSKDSALRSYYKYPSKTRNLGLFSCNKTPTVRKIRRLVLKKVKPNIRMVLRFITYPLPPLKTPNGHNTSNLGLTSSNVNWGVFFVRHGFRSLTPIILKYTVGVSVKFYIKQ